MTRRLITCVLAATTALAQTPGKAPKSRLPGAGRNAGQARSAAYIEEARGDAENPQENPPELAPDQPVISIRGLCPADTGVATQSAVPSTKQCVDHGDQAAV